jgi:hypothetical protein
MVIRRLAVACVCVGLNVALLIGCTADSDESADRTGGASAEPGGTSAAPTTSDTAPPTPSTRPKASSPQPLPKVSRSGEPETPTTSAQPASVDGTVKYPDGVALRIVNIDFSKERLKGPGSFPGRPFAILKLEIKNRSNQSLSMQTVVVTVLDKENQAVPPVYSQEAKVRDFSGTLKSGETTRARYAFAISKSSLSKVTVVVDFDGAHTSAVFRGKLE